MKPIYKMKIIQVEVTNACVHNCSNCTRFCGHFRKPFFMDYETFAKAVDSMEGFPGMVGVMGGEPTIHPQFEKLVGYYASKIENGRKYGNALKPIKNFSQYLIENDMQNIKNKRGLWSSLGNGYYKHFELIQEVFPFQLINDHSHSGLHQTLLVTRKELGIPDEKWIKMRDNCWAQNIWSASITPKGCFFCEVAAALDMLFDGPGGWPIEKGWWKRRPEDFKEQLNWCEYCSAVLNVPRVEANLETDVVSPVIYEKLKTIGSPKLKSGRVKIFPVENYNENKLECDYSSEWYLPSGDNSKRVSCTNRSLYPRKLEAIVLNNNDGAIDFSAELKQFDKAVIAASNHGEEIKTALEKLDFTDWVVIFEADAFPPPDFRELIDGWIFNPGCMYCGKMESSGKLLPYSFVLFNRNASFLRDVENLSRILSWPPEKRVMIENLRSSEDTMKRLELLGKAEKEKTVLMTAHILSFWRRQISEQPDTVLFGAGNHTKWLIAKLRENNLALPKLILDDDPDSGEIDGITVLKSDRYKDCGIKAVVISSDTYASEMTERALKIWNDGRIKVINPYSDFPDPRFQK